MLAVEYYELVIEVKDCYEGSYDLVGLASLRFLLTSKIFDVIDLVKLLCRHKLDAHKHSPVQ